MAGLRAGHPWIGCAGARCGRAGRRGHVGPDGLELACLLLARMKRCHDGASPVHRRLHDVHRPYGTLYIGVTSDLETRVNQHQTGELGGFTKRYGLRRLVWFEPHESIVVAIQRETSLKKYERDWKINLIERENPQWEDLSRAWRGSGARPTWLA